MWEPGIRLVEIDCLGSSLRFCQYVRRVIRASNVLNEPLFGEAAIRRTVGVVFGDLPPPTGVCSWYHEIRMESRVSRTAPCGKSGTAASLCWMFFQQGQMKEEWVGGYES